MIGSVCEHGTAVSSIRRVFYDSGGSVNREEGPIEINFEDGRTLLFEGGGDGQTLVVGDRQWVDPFAPPLSAENLQWVEEVGKWTAYEVDPSDPACRFIGSSIDAFYPIESFGVIAGVVLESKCGELRILVESDEITVSVNTLESGSHDLG